MFLRRYERHQNGKPHTYWALAESDRTAQVSRQRIVADLDELAPSEQNGWAKLGQHRSVESAADSSAARRPPLTLFDPPPTTAARRCPDEPRDDEPLLVTLSGIRLERTRDFGDVWLAWGLWRTRGIDPLLDELSEAGREDVSWGTMAAVLVIARFCEPSSELHIADTWYRRTALDELLGVKPHQVHTDRLYQALDQLLPHKEALEKQLRQRLGEWFELKCELLRYDITSTYFEGDLEGCPIAQRGDSRDSRPDRPQVLHRAGRDRRRLPARLRSVRWQYERFHDGPHDRRIPGAEVRFAESRVGHGPRHGQRGQPAIPPRARWPRHRGHAQGDAAAI
jgi:hypothetical protein